MRKVFTVVLMLGMSGAGMAMVGGCDKTLSDKETVKVKDDGTVVKDKEAVSQKPDGTVVKEESHTVNH
jgi:hypothetical protein